MSTSVCKCIAKMQAVKFTKEKAESIAEQFGLVMFGRWVLIQKPFRVIREGEWVCRVGSSDVFVLNDGDFKDFCKHDLPPDKKRPVENVVCRPGERSNPDRCQTYFGTTIVDSASRFASERLTDEERQAQTRVEVWRGETCFELMVQEKRRIEVTMDPYVEPVVVDDAAV